MKRENRIGWIDTVRGLGILGVIVFHTGFLPFIHITDPLLMSWILPVFVFTGGWLLKDTALTPKRLRSTVKRLLVPFFVAGAVSFAGWMVLKNIYPSNILEQPVALELIKWLTGRNAYFNSPLWFIPAYFFASLVMQAMSPSWFRMRQGVRILFAGMTAAAGLILTAPFQYPVFSYDLVFLFIGMMMMGSLASEIRIPETKYRAGIDMFIVILFVYVSLSNGYIDMFQRQFGNKFLFLVSAILGSYSVTRITLSSHVLSSLGRNSMILMAWHWPVFQWITYGLWVTGILGHIASNYTKTTFVLQADGFRLLMLQAVFCLVYTGACVYLIHTVKKYNTS